MWLPCCIYCVLRFCSFDAEFNFLTKQIPFCSPMLRFIFYSLILWPRFTLLYILGFFREQLHPATRLASSGVSYLFFVFFVVVVFVWLVLPTHKPCLVELPLWYWNRFLLFTRLQWHLKTQLQTLNICSFHLLLMPVSDIYSFKCSCRHNTLFGEKSRF